MARLRLSRPTQADVTHILSLSIARWGAETGRRHAAVVATALRRVAADPHGLGTRDRGALVPGLRSLHLRHARGRGRVGTVRRPVHVIYFRVIAPGLVEIARVLHERMEPSGRLGGGEEET